MRTRFFIAAGLALAGIFSGTAEADRRYDNGYGGQGGAEIILYSDTNFRGEARVFRGDVNSLRGSGFNNVARSVEIRGGAWTLCKNSNGRGNCQTITRSIANLGRLGLDCELTSFFQTGYNNGAVNTRGFRDQRAYAARGGRYGAGAPVVLYKKDNFRGDGVGITGRTNLRDIGFNNKVDSIAISSGQWIVCTKRDLRGKCDVLSRSVYDLDDIDLDDNISSIAPYNGRGRGRGRGW